MIYTKYKQNPMINDGGRAQNMWKSLTFRVIFKLSDLALGDSWWVDGMIIWKWLQY